MLPLPLSVFDIIGPAMAGPSSSHTAGAVRIGLIARALLGEAPKRATLALHGSFAATGRGHATDRALLAGVLGYAPDNEALPRAPELAEQAGLAFEFQAVDLGEAAHPNTAVLTLAGESGGITLTAASVGGGIIEVSALDGYETSFRGDLHTLVFWHGDRSGFLANLTAIVACVEANIATLRTSRISRASRALTVVETDGPLPADALSLLARIPSTLRLRAFSPLP